MKKLIFALIATATAVGAAQAQNAPAPYIGVGIATADHSYKIGGATVTDQDDWKAGAKIFGGVDFNQNWGLEGGYTRFGDADARYTIGAVPGTLSTKAHSFYLAGKGSVPVNEQLSVFGKLGVAHNKHEVRATLASLNRDESKNEAYAGLGAQYNLNKQVALTAEYERYGKKKDIGTKADVFTVAAKYNF
jgi:opacity protein-like surface antigen